MELVMIGILTVLIIAQAVGAELRQREHAKEKNRLINAVLARHLPEKAYAEVVEKQQIPTVEDHMNMETIIRTAPKSGHSPKLEEAAAKPMPEDRPVDADGFGGMV